MFFQLASSAATDSIITFVSPSKNTGIKAVFDTENSLSPTVVTRQFSGVPMAVAKGLEGETKKFQSVHDVVAFGGISSPSLSTIWTIDRIRAQPNADTS
jgi:hypothetical protein